MFSIIIVYDCLKFCRNFKIGFVKVMGGKIYGLIISVLREVRFCVKRFILDDLGEGIGVK